MKPPRFLDTKGLTLVELLISLVILSVLASAVLPLSQMTVKRSKELELRRNLRILRTAIDQFKKDWDDRKIAHSAGNVADAETGYPKTLEVLVAGSPGAAEGSPAFKYLRRILRDPLTASSDWGLRCYEDSGDSKVWCGRNVYDVYTRSEDSAMDGTRYAEW